MSSSRPIDNPKDPRTDEKPVFSKELVQEDLKDEFKAGASRYAEPIFNDP